MKETSIRFSDQMVRAILDGRKTQTRRIVEPQPEDNTDCSYLVGIGENRKARVCPYGVPGDRLKVEGSGIMLKIVGTRIERLQTISEESAVCEGVVPYAIYGGDVVSWKASSNSIAIRTTAKIAFADLWDHLCSKSPGASWADNPWVWTINFRRTSAPL